jgi:hypothetical protein
MAKRKRRTSSKSRSPRRSSSRSSAGVSRVGLLLAMGVIAGVGGLTVWTAAHQKNPPAILAGLFERPVAVQRKDPAAGRAKTDVKQAARTGSPKRGQGADSQAVPVPRPLVAVGPRPQKPDTEKQVQQASLQSVPAQRPQASIAATQNAVKDPPRGANLPDMAPHIVYARERLTLRRHAWNKSAPTGTVEKGREMRSYSKTGKWHRIAVPTTGMIGWVHEDMLITRSPGISGMATGAISRASTSAPVRPVYPSRSLGAQ